MAAGGLQCWVVAAAPCLTPCKQRCTCPLALPEGVAAARPAGASGQVLPWSQPAPPPRRGPGSPAPQKLLFSWELSLQSAGAAKNCWCTDVVRPISGDAMQLFQA